MREVCLFTCLGELTSKSPILTVVYSTDWYWGPGNASSYLVVVGGNG